MNKQRESVYALRRELLEGKIHITEEEAVDSREYLMTLAEELLDSTVDSYAGPDVDPDERDCGALNQRVARDLTASIRPSSQAIDLEGMRPRR